MRRDDGDEPQEYAGSFVILAHVGACWIVKVEPPLPDGQDRTRTFATKISAWQYAQTIWSDWHLPLRDLSDGNIGRAFD